MYNGIWSQWAKNSGRNTLPTAPPPPLLSSRPHRRIWGSLGPPSGNCIRGCKVEIFSKKNKHKTVPYAQSWFTFHLHSNNYHFNDDNII